MISKYSMCGKNKTDDHIPSLGSHLRQAEEGTVNYVQETDCNTLRNLL